MTLRIERDLPLARSKPGNGPGPKAAAEERRRTGGSQATAYVERDLTGWERLLLAVGVHLACAVISIADR